MGIIYAATLKADGRKYIGKSTKTLEERRSEHLKFARSERGKSHFHRALVKYGALAFEWEVLKALPDDELDGNEVAFIALFKSNDPDFGFNMTAGGEGATPSQETKDKLSEVNRGRQLTREQRDRFLAAHWARDPARRAGVAEKTRAKLAGVPLPPDHGARKKGRKHSEETRRKMAEAHKGKPKVKGYRLSDETRKRMSEAHKGKLRGPMSEETKRRISETKRLRKTAKSV